MDALPRRVAALTAALCHCPGFDHCASQGFVFATYLHDVGKAAIPPAVLDKPGRLTPCEIELVRRHTEIGAQMLYAAGHARAALVAMHHHEAWDGSGYPHGLKGDEIPFAARLVSLCDVYAALREDRPYRAGLSHASAVRLITEDDRSSGTRPNLFDPQLLAVFARHHRRFRATVDVVQAPARPCAATELHA